MIAAHAVDDRWDSERIARGALVALLVTVAGAAVAVSFDGLRDLGTAVGFERLDALLPVVIDAGAAAGTVAWLSGWAPVEARKYGRAMAVALLFVSVGGNALLHGLRAAGVAPHWLVAVGVGAVVPAVVFACVHLFVLTFGGGTSWSVRGVRTPVPPAPEPVREDVLPDVPPVPPEPVRPAVPLVPVLDEEQPVHLHAVPPVRSELHRTRLAELVREYGPGDVLPSATAIRTRYGCNAKAAKLLHADLLRQAREAAS